MQPPEPNPLQAENERLNAALTAIFERTGTGFKCCDICLHVRYTAQTALAPHNPLAVSTEDRRQGHRREFRAGYIGVQKRFLRHRRIQIHVVRGEERRELPEYQNDANSTRTGERRK